MSGNRHSLTLLAFCLMVTTFLWTRPPAVKGSATFSDSRADPVASPEKSFTSKTAGSATSDAVVRVLHGLCLLCVWLCRPLGARQGAGRRNGQPHSSDVSCRNPCIRPALFLYASAAG